MKKRASIQTLKSQGKSPKLPEKRGDEKGEEKPMSRKEKFKAMLEKWKAKKGKK
jgi:hypothetical protein